MHAGLSFEVRKIQREHLPPSFELHLSAEEGCLIGAHAEPTTLKTYPWRRLVLEATFRDSRLRGKFYTQHRSVGFSGESFDIFSEESPNEPLCSLLLWAPKEEANRPLVFVVDFDAMRRRIRYKDVPVMDLRRPWRDQELARGVYGTFLLLGDPNEELYRSLVLCGMVELMRGEAQG